MPLKLQMEPGDRVTITSTEHFGEGVEVVIEALVIGNPRRPEAEPKSVQLSLSAPQSVKFDATIDKLENRGNR